MMPKMTGDGLLVAGDAAALCLAAGIWLEGVNFAMASGMYAGEAAVEALAAGDTSPAGLAGYERRLERHVRAARPPQAAPGPEAVLSDRVQHLYPQLVANTVEAMFRVDNPTPEAGPAADPRRRTQAPRHPTPRPRPRRVSPAGGRSAMSERRAGRRSAVRGPDRHDPVRRPRARRTSSSTRDLPRLQHPRVHRRLPGQPVRADGRRRDPVQLRAVLRVRHLLPRVQRGGRDLVVVPEGGHGVVFRQS